MKTNNCPISVVKLQPITKNKIKRDFWTVLLYIKILKSSLFINKSLIFLKDLSWQ